MPKVMIGSNVTTGIWSPSLAFASMLGMKPSILVIACMSQVLAADPFKAPAAVAPPKPAHDGLHDFDFAVGAWKEHTVRLQNPLTGSTTWFEMDGYSVSRQALGGRLNLVEYEGDGPKGHLSLIAVRIYDPASHQWRMNFSTPTRGALWPTPMVGEFRDGRGELYSVDDIDGRAIMVRFTVTSLSPTSHRSEQAFSADGGKTWETNWINTYTRITERELPRPSVKPEPHDFDFDTGTSKVRITRLLEPLSGSTKRGDYVGTHVVHKIWDGRADLVELSADGPAGHLEGVGLRLYNPTSHQWNLNWLNRGAAYFGPPTIGAFHNGRGEFYDTEDFGGRAILLRNVWSDITPTTAKFEQAFSADGGKTWETNWTAAMTHAR